MDILGTIRAHAAAMKLPLYAVTLSAVAKAETPVMLGLHWHGFRRHTAMKLARMRMPMRPVPGSVFQINLQWGQVEHLDQAMLEAAWRLGAWDLERINHRPCMRLNAPVSEALACHRAFGFHPHATEGQVTMVDAPDQAMLIDMAAARGYVRWLFHPRDEGLWNVLDEEDITLEGGRFRRSPCPVHPHPYDRHRHGRSIYRLGRGGSLLC